MILLLSYITYIYILLLLHTFPSFIIKKSFSRSPNGWSWCSQGVAWRTTGTCVSKTCPAMSRWAGWRGPALWAAPTRGWPTPFTPPRPRDTPHSCSGEITGVCVCVSKCVCTIVWCVHNSRIWTQTSERMWNKYITNTLLIWIEARCVE